MPKRRTAAQFEAAKSSGDPPERAKYGDDNSWWDAQHEWVVKDPVGISEHVALMWRHVDICSVARTRGNASQSSTPRYLQIQHYSRHLHGRLLLRRRLLRRRLLQPPNKPLISAASTAARDGVYHKKAHVI